MHDQDGEIGHVYPGINELFEEAFRILGGLRKGELTAIVGRPDADMRSVTASIALEKAKQGHQVLYFSLGGRRPELLSQLVEAGDATRSIPLETSEQMIEACSDVFYSMSQDLPLFIFDEISLDLGKIEKVASAALRRKAGDLDKDVLIIIDYVEMLSDFVRGNFQRSSSIWNEDEVGAPEDCDSLMFDKFMSKLRDVAARLKASIVFNMHAPRSFLFPGEHPNGGAKRYAGLLWYSAIQEPIDNILFVDFIEGREPSLSKAGLMIAAPAHYDLAIMKNSHGYSGVSIG